MKRALIAILGLPVLATVVLADSPHFLFAKTSIRARVGEVPGSLTISFKDAGLGTGTTSIEISATVNAVTATYQCFNNEDNPPTAGNKKTVSTSSGTSATFEVRNGQTTDSFTFAPPGPGSFACPSGETLFLQDVVYWGISVSDSTGNTLEATPDPITSGTLHSSSSEGSTGAEGRTF